MTRSTIHREKIKAALRETHGSVEAFERLKKLPHHSVSDVLRGRTVKRTAEAIAAELGKKTSEIWPGRYAESSEQSDMSDGNRAQASGRRLSAGAR